MRNVESNVTQNIFYSEIKRELFKIARSTLCLKGFMPKAKELTKRMKIIAHYYNNGFEEDVSINVYIYIYTHTYIYTHRSVCVCM